MTRTRTGSADVAAEVDAVLSGPVLVIGSLPPGGRDLDLLAGPAQYREIAEYCAASDMVARGSLWARLDPEHLVAVDLAGTEQDGLGGADVFAGAQPLPGLTNLCVPAPAAVLLLAARGVITRRGALTAKSRSRVRHALELDPDAWTGATGLAGPVGLAGAVEALHAAYSGAAPSTVLFGYLRGNDPVAVKRDLLRRAAPQRALPTVVSFSGLDGSGKSTQADLLADALRELGVRTERNWTGYSTSPKLYAAWSVVDRWRRRRPVPAVPDDRPAASGAADAPDVIPPVSASSPAAAHAWISTTAVFNSLVLWREVVRHRPEALVFDRFTPDTAVKLDFFFERQRGWAISLERRLFRRLAPRPAIGFLLHVPGDVAIGRRREQWTAQETRAMADLYAARAVDFGLVVLDGTRPPGELHRRILRETWQRL